MEKNWKDFEEQLLQIRRGKMIPPNFEELSLEKGIANIAAGGGLISYNSIDNFKHPNGKSSWGHWARFFLGGTQGGALDGSGYVIWYDHEVGKVGRFALCKHKSQEGAGADHRRGWHPSHCSLCGLNTSVDSGD